MDSEGAGVSLEIAEEAIAESREVMGDTMCAGGHKLGASCPAGES